MLSCLYFCTLQLYLVLSFFFHLLLLLLSSPLNSLHRTPSQLTLLEHAGNADKVLHAANLCNLQFRSSFLD